MLFEMKQFERNPLYISDFQKALESLPESQRQKVVLCLRLSTASHCRWLEFYMPSDAALAESPELGERYLLAMMNNFISSFGGELLEIYYPFHHAPLEELCRRAEKAFQSDVSLNNRVSYGVYLNYINRMNPHLGLNPFQIKRRDISLWSRPEEVWKSRIYESGNSGSEREMLRLAATTLDEKCFCSLDVGGNSIKGAVVNNGEIAFLKEHRWYPTGCRTSEELLEPILLMLRFLRGCAALEGGYNVLTDNTLKSGLSVKDLQQVVNKIEEIGGEKVKAFAFDGVVIGFPDIVVHNKIAGGESFKQKGVKENFGDRYDQEFAKMMDLDKMAGAYVKPGGATVVLNDGNAASFITSVEQAFLENSIIDENGMFINTIGTEMGTGFISRAGTIHYFPLEGFQQIIDLGSSDFARYPAEDIRSINSMNTGLPGTVQKYATQLGLFRMAATGLLEQDLAAFNKLMEAGLFYYEKESDRLIVPVEPQDRRNELTRALIGMLENGHPILVDTFHRMGKVMGVLMDQSKLIFPEICSTRLLSGGIIAPDCAFQAVLDGLSEHNPDYKLIRLDENIMHSPLLKKMRPHQRNFNVAIGSAYIGNFMLQQSAKP